MYYYNRFNADAGKRIRLPSIKLDIKDTCKRAKRYLLLVFENVVMFH